jgi:hypothetical protein
LTAISPANPEQWNERRDDTADELRNRPEHTPSAHLYFRIQLTPRAVLRHPMPNSQWVQFWRPIFHY